MFGILACLGEGRVAADSAAAFAGRRAVWGEHHSLTGSVKFFIIVIFRHVRAARAFY